MYRLCQFLLLFIISKSINSLPLLSINPLKQLGNIGLGKNQHGNGISFIKQSLYSIESYYECTGDLVANLHGYKFIQTNNKRCNEVSGQIQTYNLTAVLWDRQTIVLSVSATTFVDDYKGMRIMASDGIIQNSSQYCGGDRIVMIEVQLPKIGNCHIGIFEQESILALVRIRGKCDSFCPGKVTIHYITPLGNN